MIDLTLNSLLIPDIQGYTPPFGTKIVTTTDNLGGLSTEEVNANMLLSFAKLRAIEVNVSDETSQVEFDAKLVITETDVVITMGSSSYIGCNVKIYTKETGVVVGGYNIPSYREIILRYDGVSWENISLPSIGEVWVQKPPTTYTLNGETVSVTFPDAATYWGGGEWVQLNYDGAFFRACGGNASAYGSGVQGDQNKAHTHTINNPMGGYTSVTAGATLLFYINGSIATTSSGGNETRPLNLSEVYWYRVG